MRRKITIIIEDEEPSNLAPQIEPKPRSDIDWFETLKNWQKQHEYEEKIKRSGNKETNHRNKK
jgi:hypothetical protein